VRLSGELIVTLADEKYRILLEVAQAAGSHLELAAVLEAAFRGLQPFVPFDLIAINRVVAGRLFPIAVYVPGVELQAGESAVDAAARGLRVSREQVPQGIPLPGSATEHVGRTGKAYVAADLDRVRAYPEDEGLHPLGVRSYVRTPLQVREGLLGSLIFARMFARGFSAEEVALLEDVSPAIALAVANSLAYEEIRQLKDRLAAENRVLREEIDRESMFEEIVGGSRPLRDVLARVERVAATVRSRSATSSASRSSARSPHRGARCRDRPARR
jgi:formate hydrogenlyase transcriptional activator